MTSAFNGRWNVYSLSRFHVFEEGFFFVCMGKPYNLIFFCGFFLVKEYQSTWHLIVFLLIFFFFFFFFFLSFSSSFLLCFSSSFFFSFPLFFFSKMGWKIFLFPFFFLLPCVFCTKTLYVYSGIFLFFFFCFLLLFLFLSLLLSHTSSLLFFSLVYFILLSTFFLPLFIFKKKQQ